MRMLLVALLSVSLLSGMPVAFAATANKDTRSKMTDKQKSDLREKAWAWCRAHYAGGGAYVFRVDILSNGQARCWMKS